MVLGNSLAMVGDTKNGFGEYTTAGGQRVAVRNSDGDWLRGRC